MTGITVVVDYGLCNLDSIVRALEECGARTLVADEPGPVETAERLVLPGVGAFPNAISNLRKAGMIDAMNEAVLERQVPFLGICLGMQLVARIGYEVRETEGLGWLDATVQRLIPVNGERIPHMGWNDIKLTSSTPLFAGVEPERDFYFVHSYHIACTNPTDIAATTDYAGGFTSAIARDNLFGVQFHPEKSQKLGHRILTNFLAV